MSSFKCSDHCEITPKLPFQRPIPCDKMYVTIKDITNHLKDHLRQRQSELSFKCAFCATIFPTAKQVKRHERVIHLKVNVFAVWVDRATKKCTER
jgi:uncharacterized C2H2 Zn-finger protein